MACEVGAELVGREDNGSGHECQINSVVILTETCGFTFVNGEKSDRIYFTSMRVLLGGGRCGEPQQETTSCERHQGWAQEEARVVGLESPQDPAQQPLLKMTRCSTGLDEGTKSPTGTAGWSGEVPDRASTVRMRAAGHRPATLGARRERRHGWK
jgi:hypothetical protein